MAFRSFRRSRGRRGILRTGLWEIVQKAHSLLGTGQTLEAAPLFADLAQTADGWGHTRRAARLHAKAAQSYAAGGDDEAALSHGRTALNQLIQLGRQEQAGSVLISLTQTLRQAGHQVAADTLQREFAGVLGLDTEQLSSLPQGPAPSEAPHGRLPAQCPACGAPVRSDEVEWIDLESAECLYCGNVIQTLP